MSQPQVPPNDDNDPDSNEPRRAGRLCAWGYEPPFDPAAVIALHSIPNGRTRIELDVGPSLDVRGWTHAWFDRIQHELERRAAQERGTITVNDSRFDPVHNPAHYRADIPEGFAPIDIIDDWRLGFSLGNAVKYILRAKRKGNEKQDLEKARWYLDHALEIGERPQLSYRFTNVDAVQVANAYGFPVRGAIYNVLSAIHVGRAVDIAHAHAVLGDHITQRETENWT